MTMLMNSDELRCMNCGSYSWLPRETGNRLICNHCQSWTSMMNSSAIDVDIYDESYFSGQEYLNYTLGLKVHNLNFQRKIKLLKQTVGAFSELRILEIGSATGAFLNIAKREGCHKHIGIEISDYARDIAIKNGLNVLSPFDPDLMKLVKAMRPNVIVAWDVWEHLQSPADILSQYIDCADEQLCVALTTVDSSSLTAKLRQEKWRQYHPPSHLQYPTKKAMEIFMKSKNLTIEKHFYFGYYRPLAEYLNAFIPKQKYIKNSKLLFQIPLYLNLFDTQLVIASRNWKP